LATAKSAKSRCRIRSDRPRAFQESELEQFLIFLQKNPFNLLLFGAAVISGAMLIWPILSRLIRPGNEVDPLGAVQLINRRDAVVIDVRDSGDFAAGHIANARHIPEAELADRIRELQKFKSRPIIVSCRTGSRSAIASGILRKNGFSDVFALRGGIAAWQQANMPLER
jgi:rhodanese-related sulfurtransferase